MPFVPEFRPGLYKHYKGALYEALHLARLSEDREKEVVVYYSVEKKQVWVRPYAEPGQDSWTDIVEWPDGEKRQRFTLAAEVM